MGDREQDYSETEKMNKLNNGVLATPDKVSIAELIEADIALAEFLREYLPQYLLTTIGDLKN